MNEQKQNVGHTNPDAITGAPGSHPGATAIGTASGTATGAAIGMVGGPVGIVVGGVVGGIVGAAIGHSAGEWHDPSDRAYWRGEYRNRPYYDAQTDFDRDLEPAYRFGSNLGVQASTRPANDRGFETVEESARSQWLSVRDKSQLSYDQARNAVSDAYNRRSSLRQPISDNDNVAH